MDTSWIVLLVIALLNGGQSVSDLVTEEETEHGECLSETCGPNPHAVPMTEKEKSLPEADEAASTHRSYYGIRTPPGRQIPKTNFRCNDKPYTPGFYADVEAECQIFHLCLSSEVDHFMCPLGTAFNQKSLVCESRDKVSCHLSPTFYSVNEKLRTGPSAVLETKETVPDEESNRWLFHLLKGDEENATSEDILERNLIRMFILMQFQDISQLLADIVHLENESFSQLQGEMLDYVIREVFPLLPVKFGTEPIMRSEQDSTEAPEPPKLVKRNADESTSRTILEDILEEDSGSRPTFGGSNHTPDGGHDAKQRARRSLAYLTLTQKKIGEAVLNIIGTITGRISQTARTNVVWNYINHINHYLKEAWEKLKRNAKA